MISNMWVRPQICFRQADPNYLPDMYKIIEQGKGLKAYKPKQYIIIWYMIWYMYKKATFCNASCSLPTTVGLFSEALWWCELVMNVNSALQWN